MEEYIDCGTFNFKIADIVQKKDILVVRKRVEIAKEVYSPVGWINKSNLNLAKTMLRDVAKQRKHHYQRQIKTIYKNHNKSNHPAIKSHINESQGDRIKDNDLRV